MWLIDRVGSNPQEAAVQRLRDATNRVQIEGRDLIHEWREVSADVRLAGAVRRERYRCWGIHDRLPCNESRGGSGCRSAQKKAQDEICGPAKRRPQQAGGAPARLDEDAFGVAERQETLLAVVGTHAAGPDAAERKVVLGVVEQRVVDCRVAARGPLQDSLDERAV